MTADEIKQRFPNASQSFIQANLDTDHKRTVAVVERSIRHEPLASDKGKEAATGKLLVSFISVRKRLLDPDNVAVKWTLDSLRYAGIIRGDEPDKIALEVSQRKALKGETERTIIKITPI